MADNSNLPKWATLDRQNYLVNLWKLYGNQCLQGHTACPDLSHYIKVETVACNISVPVDIPATNSQGNPITDSQGNQLYLTVNKPVTVYQQKNKQSRLYDLKEKAVIAGWKDDDKVQSQADWEAEQKAMHSLGEKRYPLAGRFSAISQRIYADNQPAYFLQGLGFSGVTLRPFAKVRISSSYMRLYIDIGDQLKQVSKARRRKAIRYGKALPVQIERDIYRIVREAVKDYLAH